jgi:hypothetical protein
LELIKQILAHEDLIKNPPVLIDIGASGNLLPEWAEIAPFSICLAFDADKRDIDYLVEEGGKFQKLITINSIVVDKNDDYADFYLTKYPYSSSTLKPLNKQLENWNYYQLFEIESTIKLKSVCLSEILNKFDIRQIDWFKTDSQGTDLRLFKSLSEKIRSKIIVADFEPGIIDAYQNEDKLYHLLKFMDSDNFWISDIELFGSQRINKKIKQIYFPGEDTGQLASRLKSSPGWAEITYINAFEKSDFSKREFLLGIVFSLVKNQFAFALQLAHLANEKFRDPYFEEIIKYLINIINSSPSNSKKIKKIIKDFIPPIFLRQYNKVIARSQFHKKG